MKQSTLRSILSVVYGIALTSCAHQKEPVWVRSDQAAANSKTVSRSSLTARDLAGILGIYDEIFQLRPPAAGHSWLMRVTYEEMGKPAKELFSVSSFLPEPLLIASRTEGDQIRYWANLSAPDQHLQFLQAVVTPPITKHSYRWWTAGELGAGRWVIRRWTDDSPSSNDPGDMRFKARILLEIKEN